MTGPAKSSTFARCRAGIAMCTRYLWSGNYLYVTLEMKARTRLSFGWIVMSEEIPTHGNQWPATSCLWMEALFPWDRLDKEALPHLCYFLRSSRSEGSVHAPHTSTCASRASSSPKRRSTPLVSFQKWDFDKILTRNKQKLHLVTCAFIHI
jgi:hypothetical protein